MSFRYSKGDRLFDWKNGILVMFLKGERYLEDHFKEFDNYKVQYKVVRIFPFKEPSIYWVEPQQVTQVCQLPHLNQRFRKRLVTNVW